MDTSSNQPPTSSHHVIAHPDPGSDTWRCTCTQEGIGLSYAEHVDTHAALAIAAMNEADLADALLRFAAEDPCREAAVGLLIAHGSWLHNGYLRRLMCGSWEPDTTLRVWVPWRDISRMLEAQRHWPPAEPWPPLRERYGDGSDLRALMLASTSELAILSIACSIAAPVLAVNLYEVTNSLGKHNRTLAVTALWHMLSHGGRLPLAGEPTNRWPRPATAGQTVEPEAQAPPPHSP